MKVFISIPDVVYSLFPNYTVIEEFGYVVSEKRVLYFLKEGDKIVDLDRALAACFKDYVLVTKVPSHTVDLILADRPSYLRYVSGKRGIKESKEIEKKVESLSDEEFLHFLKMSIVLRRWYRESFGKYEKVYNLFAAMVKSKKDFIGLYAELRKKYSEQEIFSSMLTFFSRVQNYQEQKDSISDFYREIVRVAKAQSMSIKSALRQAVSLPAEIPVENVCLGFYLSVKG